MGEAKRRGTREQRVAALHTASGVLVMTPERYNAFVAWTRSPTASIVGEELEFFSNREETLIGVLIKDRFDRDFGFVVLGRDLKGRFRCIDASASMTQTNARHSLFESLRKHTESGDTEFPQGDEVNDSVGVDLFALRAPAEHLHPAFRLLSSGAHWTPARRIMSEMMRHFIDVDGNFVQQFQTTAFDSRIWELYLYAALLELGLYVTKEHEAPDFEVRDGRQKAFIEAVIVGRSPKDPPLEARPDGSPHLRSDEEIRELIKTRVPIRFGSALFSKLNRKTPYWELEHVKGHPLIFAVADFHENQSMTWTSPALVEYLYGVTHDFAFDSEGRLVISPLRIETHEHEGKVIPSGYFLQPGAENVSAVLFSSSGTISKFNRMGMLAGFGLSNQRIYRTGIKHRHDQNAALPEPFFHEIRQGVVTETWAEGLSMFHNPRAVRPVDPEMFPGIAHNFFDGGQVKSLLPEFHPYSSFTWNMMLTEHGDEIGAQQQDGERSTA
jgi:hypothetical protein